MSVPREYEEEISYHEELFAGSAWELGRMHLYIQEANTEMTNRRYFKEGKSRLRNRTPFGNEVGRDEIYWWVFKRETQIEELKKRTEAMLKSAQKLKENSLTLRTRDMPKTYKALIETIRDFAEGHEKEIHDALEYVLWLRKKDILAPKILFTYRVWGSTNLSDRAISVTAQTSEDHQTVEKCVEIVFGLRKFGTYTVKVVYKDVLNEIVESVDDEYLGPISVPKQRVISRAAYAVLDQMGTYFECLRQSLRNIIIDIERYNEQRRLLCSEPFWRSFVQKAMRSGRVENQLWDLKATLEIWHPEHGQREKAEVKLCEEITSFANTKGGVLVVGITDKPPRGIIGIQNLEDKLKHTKDVLLRHIAYERDFTHFQQVLLRNGQDKDNTVLVIVVAQTKGVASVKDQRGRYTYPRRAETGLDRTDLDTIKKSKANVMHDNYNFIRDLYNFLYDQRFTWSV